MFLALGPSEIRRLWTTIRVKLAVRSERHESCLLVATLVRSLVAFILHNGGLQSFWCCCCNSFSSRLLLFRSLLHIHYALILLRQGPATGRCIDKAARPRSWWAPRRRRGIERCCSETTAPSAAPGHLMCDLEKGPDCRRTRRHRLGAPAVISNCGPPICPSNNGLDPVMPGNSTLVFRC